MNEMMDTSPNKEAAKDNVDNSKPTSIPVPVPVQVPVSIPEVDNKVVEVSQLDRMKINK